MPRKPNAFGQQLRRDRSAAGLSIRQLAQIASIDYSYVSKIETGAGITRLSLAVVRALAAALKADEVEYFRLSGFLPSQLETLLSSDQSLEFVRTAAELPLADDDWQALRGFLARRIARKTEKPSVKTRGAAA